MDEAAVRKRCEEIAKGWTLTGPGGNCVDYLYYLYRAAYADGMEEAAKIADSHAGELTREMCDGCGNEDDVATGASNDCARDIAVAIRQIARHAC